VTAAPAAVSPPVSLAPPVLPGPARLQQRSARPALEQRQLLQRRAVERLPLLRRLRVGLGLRPPAPAAELGMPGWAPAHAQACHAAHDTQHGTQCSVLHWHAVSGAQQ